MYSQIIAIIFLDLPGPWLLNSVTEAGVKAEILAIFSSIETLLCLDLITDSESPRISEVLLDM